MAKKTEQTEQKISIVNLSNYVQPEVREVPYKEYVTYGEKNYYYQYLIDRSRGSATNGAVLNSLVDLIYGNGLSATNKAMKPDEWAQFLSIFRPNDVKKAVHDLKTLGQCAFQIQYAGGHKSVKSAEHIPIETLALEKADDGEINAVYYAPDWSKVRAIEDTERIPMFGTSKEGIEILYIKPYRSGLYYYSTVDYQGGLQYCELEEEIGNYHINNIQNGLAPSMLINMNNGVPTSEEKAKKIERKIQAKYSGSSNAGKIVLMFNDNKESESTITPIPLSDASEQYQFLSTESSQKILTSHRVVSPLLIGLPSATGFSSNADEMENALVLTEWWVAKPFRQLIIEEINKVLAFNEIALDLFFESINPFKAEVQIEKLSEHFNEEEFIESLAQNAPEGYEEFLVEDVTDEPEDLDYQELYNQLNLTGATKKSSGDTKLYKVRYRYKQVHTEGKSRKFCTKIRSLSGQKQYFRKEDINFMSFKGVNKSHGHEGQNYSIWKYKGGVNCHDIWERVIFKKKLQSDGTPFEGNPMQNVEVVERGYKLPKYPKIVATAPSDMPYEGHHPKWVAEHLI